MPTYQIKNDRRNHQIETDRSLSEEELKTLALILRSFPHVSDHDWPYVFFKFKPEDFPKHLVTLASNAFDTAGNTVLGVAAENGKHVDALQRLINMGADVNALDKNKRPALYWAICNGLSFFNKNSLAAAKVVECLLDNGARSDIICYYDQTVAEFAQSKGYTAASKLIQGIREEAKLEDDEIRDFFNKYLGDEVKPINLDSYPKDRDGGLNPALKILNSENKKNTIENDRWEIFVLLKNEENKLSLRSGIKSETWDFDDLRVTEQFDFSFFPKPLTTEINQLLRSNRFGHPSLALNFKQLDKGQFETLPVYAGGWLMRNDLSTQKRVQVYWSSGRYSQSLSDKARHWLQLCVAFQLMKEYGRDFIIEFYPFESIKMADFITKKTERGLPYTWEFVKKEVMQLKYKEEVDAREGFEMLSV